MAASIRVLSIDGGGIRGIIAAMFLAELERRAEAPVSELFDLIVGTSIGGVLALALTLPDENGNPEFSAADTVAIFETSGAEIFPVHTIPTLRTLRNFVYNEKYLSQPIIDFHKRQFGDTRLRDALTKVVVTTFDIENRKPRFFKSDRTSDQNFFMWQVAYATGAAPTFFEPYFSDKDPKTEGTLVDGGVFANAPALCAYAEALEDIDTRRLEKKPILLVSLGNGYSNRSYTYKDSKDWGQIGWALPLIDIVFDGMGASVDYQLERFLPDENGTKRYYRFQLEIAEDHDNMDDASARNIQALKNYGQRMIDAADQSGELAALKNRLIP